MKEQKKYTKDDIIARQKRDAYIFLGIILVLGLVSVVKTFEALRYQIILDGVKEEFKDITIIQTEMLSYCMEQGKLNETLFFDDFLRFKTEEIIMDNKNKTN